MLCCGESVAMADASATDAARPLSLTSGDGDEVFDVGIEMDTSTVAPSDVQPAVLAPLTDAAPAAGDSPHVGNDHSHTASRGDGFALLDHEGRMPVRGRARPCCGPWVVVGATLALGLAVVLVLLASGDFDSDSMGGGTLTSADIGPCSPGNDMWRLPADVSPSSYSLALRPSFAEPYDFSGSVVIEAMVNPSAAANGIQCVYLNAQDLDITSVVVSKMSGTPVAPVAVEQNSVTTVYAIRLPWSVKAGTALQLSLDFKGTLNRNMEGLYLSTYVLVVVVAACSPLGYSATPP